MKLVWLAGLVSCPLGYGVATMLQPSVGNVVYACITVNKENVFIKILILMKSQWNM